MSFPMFPKSLASQKGEEMTLRDWFAGQVMAHFMAMAREAFNQGVLEGTGVTKSASLMAYEAADALLAARTQEKG